MRVGQNQPRVVRLVIDLKQATAPQLFTLAPVAAYHHRLVFDLYPIKELDPLLALIRDKEQAEPQGGAVGPGCARRVHRPHESAAASAAAGPPPPVAGAGPTAPPVLPVLPPPVVPPVLAQSKIDRLVVVAIDPGHGGEDPGAIGPTGLREKDVVLAIAMQLRDRINANPTCARC